MSAAYPALNSEKTPSLSAHEPDQNRELSPDKGRPKDRSQEADEAHLLKAFQKGNIEAFGVLVHRYQDRLYTALTRFLDNKEDALDVLQDTFMSAFANAGNFKGNSRFYTWVYRIGMNHAIDLHRKKKPRATISIYQGDQPEYADPREDGGPHEEMIREEERQLIRKALQAWPVRQIAKIDTVRAGVELAAEKHFGRHENPHAARRAVHGRDGGHLRVRQP